MRKLGAFFFFFLSYRHKTDLWSPISFHFKLQIYLKKQSGFCVHKASGAALLTKYYGCVPSSPPLNLTLCAFISPQFTFLEGSKGFHMDSELTSYLHVARPWFFVCIWFTVFFVCVSVCFLLRWGDRVFNSGDLLISKMVTFSLP